MFVSACVHCVVQCASDGAWCVSDGVCCVSDMVWCVSDGGCCVSDVDMMGCAVWVTGWGV